MDIFSFPEEFKIDRTLTAEEFVANANLTPKEKEILIAHLKGLSILYVILLKDDSEIIVLFVDLEYGKEPQGFVRELTMMIASSFPYKCIVLVKKGIYAKLFTFVQRSNKGNETRSFIEQVRSTKTFNINKPDQSVLKLIDYMNSSINRIDNVNDLERMWNVFMDSVTLNFADRYAMQNI